MCTLIFFCVRYFFFMHKIVHADFFCVQNCACWFFLYIKLCMLIFFVYKIMHANFFCAQIVHIIHYINFLYTKLCTKLCILCTIYKKFLCTKCTLNFKKLCISKNHMHMCTLCMWILYTGLDVLDLIWYFEFNLKFRFSNRNISNISDI